MDFRRLLHLGRGSPIATEIPNAETAPPTIDPYDALLRSAPVAHLQSAEVTKLLYSRLADSHVDAVMSPLNETERAQLTSASGADRMRMLISFAVYYGNGPALGALGLTAGTPPDDVHAMSRGPYLVDGGCKYADLVVDALGAEESVLEPGARILDFGCSSGRVVRVLAAAYPQVAWHGCDPNSEAIRWGQENLSPIEFSVSSGDPPLAQYADQAFDMVFAISIWSHFAEGAAVRWLDEVRRIIKPGGLLIMTTHGFRSVGYLAENKLYDWKDLEGIRDALYSTGFWFAPVFGEAGDWGHVHADWGQAFMSPEWLLAHACPEWAVMKYGLGRVENNQDVYTLRRV